MMTISLALLEHYVDYARSPGFLLALLMIIGPICLEVFKNKALKPIHGKRKIPGCFRLGLTKRSNLGATPSRKHNRHTSISSTALGSSPSRTSVTGNARVKALFTYPVKSCRGVELAASEIVSTGLKYDRTFTFALLAPKSDTSEKAAIAEDNIKGTDVLDHEWSFITQREFPRLATLKTELWIPDPRTTNNTKSNGSKVSPKLRAKKTESTQPSSEQGTPDDSWAANGGVLILEFPYSPPFNPFGLRTETVTIPIPLAPTTSHAQVNNYALEPLRIWKDTPQAINITSEISASALTQLQSFLNIRKGSLGLFRVDASNHRTVTRCLPKDTSHAEKRFTVGFADAFPFHMLNIASVQALDENLPPKDPQKGNLDPRRFRANVYVTGPPAYAEDSWKRVTIGRCVQPHKSGNGKLVETEAEYHVACRTARCKLPNVDQDSGVKDRNEPSTTLSKTRKVDKGAYPHPVLGVQMIPLFQQGILRVGDEVQVLERGEHVYEKMFS